MRITTSEYMCVRNVLLAGAAATILCCDAAATPNGWPKGISKGTTVVVKVPFDQYEKERTGGIGLARVTVDIYSIDVERVLSTPNWNTRTFPLMSEFQVEKINEGKGPSGVRFVQIEVRNPDFWVKLRFDQIGRAH